MGTDTESILCRHLYFLISGHCDAQPWASQCPDINQVWHRMLYSCTHMATVGVKGIRSCQWLLCGLHQSALCLVIRVWWQESSRSKTLPTWRDCGADARTDQRWTMTSWVGRFDSIIAKASFARPTVHDGSSISSVPTTSDTLLPVRSLRPVITDL